MKTITGAQLDDLHGRIEARDVRLHQAMRDLQARNAMLAQIEASYRTLLALTPDIGANDAARRHIRDRLADLDAVRKAQAVREGRQVVHLRPMGGG